LVGSVEIGGRTVEQAEQLLRAKFASFLKSPQVSISVVEFGSQRISVVGAVATPGDVLLRKGNNSLVKVLSLAGGTTDQAGGVVIVIPAQGGSSSSPDSALALNRSVDTVNAVSQAKATLEGAADSYRTRGIELPLDAILGTSGSEPIDLPLIGGDVVVVPPSGQVQVEGEVERRGTYDLGGKMSLLGALAAAGGITYGALIDQIEVVRKLHSNDKVVLVYDLRKLESGEQSNIALRGGDVVRVPSSSGRRVAQDVMQSLRQMINFGVGGNYRMGGP
jgi:polysaccharide export outer membrane protein